MKLSKRAIMAAKVTQCSFWEVNFVAKLLLCIVHMIDPVIIQVRLEA